MPDLPGSSPESDLWMFEEAIKNPDLQFDDLKIYPTAICKSHDDDHVLTSVISEWYDKLSLIHISEATRPLYI